MVEHWSPKPKVVSSSLASRALKKSIVGNLKLYLKDVYSELVEKTTWPSFKQLQKDSLLVLSASVLFALILKVMDIVFHFIMDIIY